MRGAEDESIAIPDEEVEATSLGLEHYASIALHNLGYVETEMGHLSEAVAHLERAARFWADLPGNPFADFSDLVQAVAATGDFERAHRLADVALDKTRSWPRPLAEAKLGELGGVDGEDQHRDCAELQAGAPGVTPVHFLHGDFTFGGIYAHNVSRFIPPDQPVYLLEPPAPGEFDSIESAARGAVGHIRSVQPAGPYLLLGVCNGGVIAFEAARQLVAAGEEVLDVIAVNASGSNSMLGPVDLFVRVMARARGMSEPERIALFLDLRERVMRHAAMARRRGQPGLPAIGTRMLLRGMRNTLRRLSSGARPGRINPVSGPASTDSRGRHIALMMQAYVPRHYDGHLTLVLSHEDANLHLPDPTAGWGRVAPRIEVFTVPGNHHDSLVGHASSLGGTIAAILRAVRHRTATPDGGVDHSAA